MGDRRFNQRLSAPDYRVKRGVVTKQSGLGLTHVATATWDWEGLDSAGVANSTAAAHGSGVYLPDNAIVLRAFYDVVETFTSSGDDATIALHAQSAGDIMVETAISATNPGVWDAGLRSARQAQSLTTAGYTEQFKTTAERELVMTVADHALTAGTLVLYVEYVLSD